jgi:two-component system nitrogen regulation sensor histidine kinase NtrY
MFGRSKNGLLVLSLIFFIAGMVLGIIKKPTLNADEFAKRVESHLQEMEQEVDNLVKEKITLAKLARKIPISDNQYQKLDVFSKPYTINIFDKDSIIFWNNINVGNDLHIHGAKLDNDKGKLVQLPNGIFYIRNDSIPNLGKVITAFPIKYEYKIETIYLRNTFAVDRFTEDAWHSIIPTEKLDIVLEDEGSSIHNIKGERIFSLKAKSPVKMPWVSYALFTLYLMSFVFGVLWLTQLSRNVSRNQKPWMGVLLLGGLLFLIRWLMLHFDAVESFQDVPMFSVRYSTNSFADTVGDMLTNSLLSVWVAVFFYKEFKIHNSDQLGYNNRLILSLVLYSTIIAGILSITYVLKGLVLETDIPFDFEKIGDLRWSSLLSIVGILFLMLMLFLFTYRISLVIRQLGLNLMERLGTLGVAVVISFFMVYLAGLDWTTLILLFLFSIIYIISFDLYVENDSSNLLWIVAWLVIYSMFSSSFLFKYNQMKEWEKRIQYAEFLTDDRDEDMEEKLQFLDKEIKADGEIGESLSNEVAFEKVEELLLRNHSVDLRFIRYQHQLHLFEEDTLGRIIPLEESEIDLLSSFEKTDITLDSNLRFVRMKNALGTYLLKIEYPQSDYRVNTIMLLEFNREVGENTKISTELFINKDYMDMQGLAEYQYAVYRNDTLVSNEGGNYVADISEIEDLPSRGKGRFKDGKSRLIYHEWNGNLAIMDIELPNFFNKVWSLNSYLFTIMVFVLGILLIINTIIQVLPFGYEPLFAPLPSLKNKIQVSVIAIIILSFFVIGVITIIFFERKNDEYHQDRLGRKARSIREDTAREIEQKEIDANSLYKFNEIVDPVSAIHRMDINIYDLKGNLIESSGKDIYSKGLLAPLMNASAFHELNTTEQNEITMDKDNSEQIGNLVYDTQYEKLRDPNGNVIAYIGMPYYSQKSKIENDTSDFIGTLLNVYVILLTMAGFITIFVAKSITRPLSQIGEKLKELKIGKKNEELEWSTKDELGDLIEEYNRMIRKLDDSTKLLAQSERESAWREMAKQVAHEIKNPLTPMKLSIQYLQYAYDSDPNNMKSMLKRVSNTLIEQIDNLAQIATEFSNFAKMPRAENEHFALNKLVQSVYDLFSEQRDMKMSISLPEQNMMVYGDKNQLMRVFNNLIKNAMQAIPEEKEGKVDVILRSLDNDIVQLEVKDNGSGIPRDMEEFIFIPQFTTKSSGTGLGLAISKSIVESLEGGIYFESIESEGTSFFVELPISTHKEE